MKSLLTVLVCLFVIELTGCGSTEGIFNNLSVGMSREEVKHKVGSPDVVRGAIRNKYGDLIEVWEYRLKQSIWDQSWETNTYWVYLCNGNVAQWGRAGDWAREADRIYEMRFR